MRTFNRRAATLLVGALLVVASCWAIPAQAQSRRSTVEGIARDALAKYHLRSIIVRVTENGKDVYTAAMGTSMTGVPATTKMHFRNGAMAFTYIGQTVAEMVDQRKVSLDDKLSKWMPELPHADDVTLKNLLNMTSGYADYVYQPETLNGVVENPERQWTNADLIRIGTSPPMDFDPGTNWGYSHTNYVILGEVLEKITGKPLDRVLDQYVTKRMKLTNTSSNGNTPAVPEPALHSYSSERREALQVPPSVPFIEDSTYWNPSWTTANGAVQTTDIYDMTRSMEMVGSGKLVSKKTYDLQTGNHLAGFGNPDPTGRCSACAHLTDQKSYGFGVVLLGPWITQTKNFAGNGATTGYLPAQKLTVSVSTTYTPDAFDASGNYQNASSAIFTELATALAPNQSPPG